MMEIFANRLSADQRRRRVHNDSLRPVKIILLSLFALVVAASLLANTAMGLSSIAGLGWSAFYIAAIMGLEDRRRWGQVLTLAILAIQPLVLAALTAPYWQLGAIIGVATLPLAAYLCKGKVHRLFS